MADHTVLLIALELAVPLRIDELRRMTAEQREMTCRYWPAVEEHPDPQPHPSPEAPVATRMRTVDPAALAIDAARTLLAEHPDQPIKLDLGGRHPEASKAAEGRLAWYVLLEPTGDGIRVSGAGPCPRGRRPTVVGEPVTVAYPDGIDQVEVAAFATNLTAAALDMAHDVARAQADARKASRRA